MSDRVGLGFRTHSGWAAAVAVTGSIGSPVVLDRRRIEIADPAIPGAKQPFHTSEPLPIEQAEELIRKCRETSLQLTISALRDFIAGRVVVSAAVLFASGRPLPDLATTLRSHALIHTAEGEFFREVLVSALESCSLLASKMRERDIRGLQTRIAGLGKSLGPPWTQDEKLASLAAWVALAGSPPKP